MFRWYQKSALTVVHLLGVLSDSEEDSLLWKSIWNTRGWTYQEYIASPVVQFYTEDWKLYRGLSLWNHKESPIIRSEMEQAMTANSRLETLRPGLDGVREKLFLASKRETTRGEDIAYCLFGIFSVSTSVIYGEGAEAAVRRLLQYILANSDNVTLLAWTGTSGSVSSTYLPPNLTVYDQVAPPHVPPPIETDKMDRTVMALQSSLDISLAVQLYDRLYDSPLSLIAGRLKLPSLSFPVTSVSPLSEPHPQTEDSSLRLYRATTAILGDVVIKTSNDLSRMKHLLFIHPWINPLLDLDFSNNEPLFDKVQRALRFIVRLRQPFGALLLTPSGRVQYKRVATDFFIQVHRSDSRGDAVDRVDGQFPYGGRAVIASRGVCTRIRMILVSRPGFGRAF